MSQPNRIQILVVDDHAMVRRGLAVFLHAFSDLELIGEAASGEEALELCRQTQPDVVLMDMMMPGMDGVMTTQAIRAAYPDIQVIALTSFSQEGLINAALQAGAIGYLFKDVSAEELAEAVRSAASGHSALAREALRVLVSRTAAPPGPTFDLTETERKVLSLICRGLNNAEIAERLGVSRSTIKTHVSNILSKMDVRSRVEAVTLALQHGLEDHVN